MRKVRNVLIEVSVKNKPVISQWFASLTEKDFEKLEDLIDNFALDRSMDESEE